jgi:hypothetical protein
VKKSITTVLIGLMALGLAACGNDKVENPPPTPNPSVSAAASPSTQAAAGDDKAACATIKEARKKIVDALMKVVMGLEPGTKKEDVEKASAELQTAIKELRAETDKAAGQAADGKLKEQLKAFGAGVDTALANVKAAGTDIDKLTDATDVESMNQAEKQILALCA